MFNVALLEPEIAGNAGNAARTCFAVGATLHLIKPLGFRLQGSALRRAGMDYWRDSNITTHSGFSAFQGAMQEAFGRGRVFAFTTCAATLHHQVNYLPGDVLLFGPESRGLPEEVLKSHLEVRVPMRAGARSLNLASAVAIALYEAWRQCGFEGA